MKREESKSSKERGKDEDSNEESNSDYEDQVTSNGADTKAPSTQKNKRIKSKLPFLACQNY